MESLFDPAEVATVKQRIANLRPDTLPQCGKMTAAQMLAHNVLSMEITLGDKAGQRMLLGRLIGGLIKPMALKDGEPMRKNSPTLPMLVMTGQCAFEEDRKRLIVLLDRFAAKDPDGPKSMHGFFGMLTPKEWSKLMHKHLDHHLRQFGV